MTAGLSARQFTRIRRRKGTAFEQMDTAPQRASRACLRDTRRRFHNTSYSLHRRVPLLPRQRDVLYRQAQRRGVSFLRCMEARGAGLRRYGRRRDFHNRFYCHKRPRAVDSSPVQRRGGCIYDRDIPFARQTVSPTRHRDLRRHPVSSLRLGRAYRTRSMDSEDV